MEKDRAILAAGDFGLWDFEHSLDELVALCDTAQLEVVAQVGQRMDKKVAATYFGKGKVEEIAQLVEQLEADCVVVDDDLSGIQTRNLEQAWNVPVIDRTVLILDIFAQRATTAEGKLQVELAQYQYRLPRLLGGGLGLSQQGGGIGTRGPGETQLETDRRHVRSRIRKLKERLREVENRREVTRRSRAKNGIPIVVLVGYTNVGKSSLLNRLTDAEVLAEDKLFATLDPTARKLSVGNLQQVILVDTVGFVSRLPHHLVEAFRSTLAEAQYADLILLVNDASSLDWPIQEEVTKGVLNDLGCGEIPTLSVFNKADLYEGEEPLPGIAVSAKTGEGLEELLKSVSDCLSERIVHSRLLFPFDQVGKASVLRERGNIIQEKWTEEGLLVEATVDRNLWNSFVQYETELEF